MLQLQYEGNSFFLLKLQFSSRFSQMDEFVDPMDNWKQMMTYRSVLSAFIPQNVFSYRNILPRNLMHLSIFH